MTIKSKQYTSQTMQKRPFAKEGLKGSGMQYYKILGLLFLGHLYYNSDVVGARGIELHSVVG